MDRAILERTFAICTLLGMSGVAGAPALASVPERGPLISGTHSWVDGTFVWTDYVYDDRGADTSGGPGGDAAYGSGLSNAADFVQLQIGLASGELHVRAILETLIDPSVPVLGVAFDTDADPATGAAVLPGGVWPAAGPLGVEELVLLSDGGGALLRFVSGTWSQAGAFPAIVDPVSNVMEATIPTSLLDPGTSVWRVFGVLGIARNGGSWVDGAAPIFDLAFVAGEPSAGWQDQNQSKVLAGALASSEAAATIDFARATDRHTELASATSPGFHTLLYHSDLDLGEGVRRAPLALPLLGPSEILPSYYAGPYQPYRVIVPDPLPPHPPVLVFMHGITQTHLSNSGLNHGLPAIVAMPLGRGELTFYMGAAEQDVRDVLADVIDRYDGDPERVVLSGFSMGAFGTFRLGVRTPDQFSAMMPFHATAGSAQYELGALPPPLLQALFSPTGFPGGNAELLENLRNVPLRMTNSQIDEYIPSPLPEIDAVQLDLLGYDYRHWVYYTRTHEVVPELSDCVLLDLLSRDRVRDPARVTYSVEPAIHHTDPASGLDLRYDSAYWISEIQARNDVDEAGEKGTIDVTSLARTDRERSAQSLIGAGQNLTEGANLCGSAPGVQTSDVWRFRGIALGDGPPQSASNGMIVRLVRLETARLDLGRMSLSTSESLSIRVEGDGPAALRLAGPWTGPLSVTRDGELFGDLTPAGGDVTLADDFDGEHEYVLTP